MSEPTFHDLATSEVPGSAPIESHSHSTVPALDTEKSTAHDAGVRAATLHNTSALPAASRDDEHLSTDRSSNDRDLEKKELAGDNFQSSNGAADRRKSSAPLDVLAHIRQTDGFHPIHWPTWKKWLIVILYCSLQAFVTLTSTTYVSVEFAIQEKFGGSTQVLTLGQSMVSLIRLFDSKSY